jgi:hypothetical protein
MPNAQIGGMSQARYFRKSFDLDFVFMYLSHAPGAVARSILRAFTKAVDGYY